jgi:predicted nuclease of predicted toxin-antitoxin system
VRDVGLKQDADLEIWDWVGKNNYTLMTADADFVALLSRRGPPPKRIHLERCDFPADVIEELLRQNAIRISEFEREPNAGLLILRNSQGKTN